MFSDVELGRMEWKGFLQFGRMGTMWEVGGGTDRLEFFWEMQREGTA